MPVLRGQGNAMKRSINIGKLGVPRPMYPNKFYGPLATQEDKGTNQLRGPIPPYYRN